jgi:hypothetical protein
VRFQSVVAYSELSLTEVIGIDHIYITVSDLVASDDRTPPNAPNEPRAAPA